jgi:hypothetical protein
MEALPAFGVRRLRSVPGPAGGIGSHGRWTVPERLNGLIRTPGGRPGGGYSRFWDRGLWGPSTCIFCIFAATLTLCNLSFSLSNTYHRYTAEPRGCRNCITTFDNMLAKESCPGRDDDYLHSMHLSRDLGKLGSDGETVVGRK